MTFRNEYVEKILPKLAYFLKKQMINERGTNFHWKTNIFVSKFWHFSIQYEIVNSLERFEIVHQKRHGHVIIVENGKIIRQTGIRRFDMLFAALNEDLILKLKNGGTFKITRKKMNERFLIKSPYFWSKIEYYLQKKESQKILFEIFGDMKYKKREKCIEKAIQFYSNNIKEFIKNTKEANPI